MGWSKYQEAIFDFVRNSTGSLVINAVAGSGKTTSIIQCAKIAAEMKKSVLFLAFNKSIATELSNKMEGTGIECKTLHSHGFRAIQKRLQYKCRVDDRKWHKYILENKEILFNALSEEDENNIESYIAETIKLLNLARINLIRSGDTESLCGIAEHHNLYVDDKQIDVVNNILSICYNLDNVVDFTDMVVLPSMQFLNRFLPKYDVIFVDEAQDLSTAQRELVLKSLSYGGRFVAVGDRQQAINGFAGADVHSFNTLANIAGNELPLSVCYRCGKKIIDAAQEIVPQIEAFENSPDGEVIRQKDIKDIKIGDMVLSRKSAPLVGLCLRLISKGNPAIVKGRDISEGLKSMIKRVKCKTVNTLITRLEKETEKVINKIEKKRQKGTIKGRVEDQPEYTNTVDKIDCIKIISEGCKTVEEVLNKLDTLFDDTKNGNVITLSTIHKAKGLEADNAYIISNNIPITYKDQQDWEYEQEMNLKYVAITRAKKRLVWVDVDIKDLRQIEVPVSKELSKKELEKEQKTKEAKEKKKRSRSKKSEVIDFDDYFDKISC